MRNDKGLAIAVWRLAVPGLLVLLVVGSGAGQDLGFDPEFEKQLDKLASTVEDLDKRVGGLKEEVARIADDTTLVHSGTSNSTMKVAGRVHIDYWGFPANSPRIDTLEGGPDGPQSRLVFRRLRFGVQGDLPANMEYKIEMEFARGIDSEFRDAYLGWHQLPLLQTVLIGNQKRPYGLDHLNSSRYNVFLERPFIIEGDDEDARRLGVQAWGVSENRAWNWRYGLFNLRNIQGEGEYVGDNLQGQVAGRLANTIWYDETSDGRGYAHWAVAGTIAYPAGSVPTDNGSVGPDANAAQFRSRPEARSATRWLDTGRIAGAEVYDLLGLEGVLNLGPVQVVGEYQHVWLDRGAGFGPSLQFHGSYVYIAYFLTGEHMPWSREEGILARPKPFEEFFLVRRCGGGLGCGWGAWQVAARWSYADYNDNDILGGIGESLTVGLNWYWTANARMQFNWLHGSIDDNAVTRGVALSGDYDIVGTRFMVDF